MDKAHTAFLHHEQGVVHRNLDIRNSFSVNLKTKRPTALPPLITCRQSISAHDTQDQRKTLIPTKPVQEFDPLVPVDHRLVPV